MMIVPMLWESVPDGTLILCPDGVQREVGPKYPGPTSSTCRRRLGTAEVLHSALRDSVCLTVQPEPALDESAMSAILLFMRSGFKVEVLPA